MPNFRTYVEIEPEEFLNNCSDSEIEEIINYLLEEGVCMNSSLEEYKVKVQGS